MSQKPHEIAPNDVTSTLFGAALNRYLPRPRNKTGVNLLATTQAEQEEARKKGEADKDKPREYISFLKPFVSIALLDDATSYPSNAVPEHVSFSTFSRSVLNLTMMFTGQAQMLPIVMCGRRYLQHCNICISGQDRAWMINRALKLGVSCSSQTSCAGTALSSLCVSCRSRHTWTQTLSP